MVKPPEDERQWMHRVAIATEKNGILPARLSVPTIVSTIGLFASVIYGIWTLNQAQLANVSAVIEQLRKDTMDKDVRLSGELSRRETELKNAIEAVRSDAIRRDANIQLELVRRHNEFTNIKEFVEYKERVLADIDVIRKQLSVLEQTRPSTGELQQVASALKDRIDRIFESLVRVEDWIRTRVPTKQ